MNTSVVVSVIVVIVVLYIAYWVLNEEEDAPVEETQDPSDEVEKRDFRSATKEEIEIVARELYLHLIDKSRVVDRLYRQGLHHSKYFRDVFKEERIEGECNSDVISSLWGNNLVSIRDTSYDTGFNGLLRRCLLVTDCNVEYPVGTKVGEQYYMGYFKGEFLYLNSCEYSLYRTFVDNKGRFKPKKKPEGLELHSGQNYLLDTKTGVEFFKGYEDCGLATKVTYEGWVYLTSVVEQHYNKCRQRWTNISRIRAERPMLELYCTCEEETND